MKNKIIITAGGTSEKIDNVRKITNSSSGKLGFTIANELLKRMDDEIDKIYYICSKTAVKPNDRKVEVIEIVDTKDLENIVRKLLLTEKINYFIHAMAVSDYTVDYVTTAKRLSDSIRKSNEDILSAILHNQNIFHESKISSYEEDLIIKLKRTPKIISLIKELSPSTYLVGFKLLDGVSEEELLDVANKLKDKNNCNLVVANDLNNIRNGEHKAFIIKSKDEYIKASGKEDIAEKLVREMFNHD